VQRVAAKYEKLVFDEDAISARAVLDRQTLSWLFRAAAVETCPRLRLRFVRAVKSAQSADASSGR
jgi:hypothetical protein|tara:strand:- start:1578 stop:1772 length:195 start_codon:yes stop_codon:yes gene_type:complete